MHYYLVAPNQTVRKGQDFFTYESRLKLKIGQIVIIELGKKSLIGVIYNEVAKPEFDTKPIKNVLNNYVLPKYLLQVALWLKDYYKTPLGLVIQTALPTGLTKSRRKPIHNSKNSKINNLQPTLEQSNAISHISNSDKTTFLVHGITGSGKTTVYLEVAKKVIASGKSVIFIVPEISLTTQLTKQVESYFDEVISLHSGLTEAKKHLNWEKCLTSKKPLVVIGARSALFAPLKNVGLIVIDEFHESSLKQDKNPKYYAVRLASKISEYSKAKLIIGSATPTIADYWIAEQKSSSIIKLLSPAQEVTKPIVKLIDMSKKINFSKHYFLSNQLLESIASALARKEQVLIFHNRRGSAKITTCDDCGWSMPCDNCLIPMSLHSDKYSMICHSCGKHSPVPTKCPECKSANISHKGIGTKLVESELRKIFKSALVKRFDTDSDETLGSLYEDIINNKIDIVIGTQIIAKGLNIPSLSVVGIIQADNGLFLPDYSSDEKTFQLISQVIGRVGRNLNKTNVIVQTYHPDHPSIKYGIKQDFDSFFDYEIKRRKQLNYPPFCFMLKLKVSYKTETTVLKHANELARMIKTNFPKLDIAGPAPSFYEKAGGKISWQLIIKSKNRSELERIIDLLPTTNWQYDIDPINLL